MIKINDSLVDQVLKKAGSSPRKRANYNFHKSYDALIQRMLNAAQLETYVRPHKHEDPDKTEVFVILKGRAAVIEFDEKGSVTDHMILDPEDGSYAVEIPPKVWHAFIALKPDTVLYEIKDGPYNETADKKFAPWSPEEGAKDARSFNEKVLERLGIK